MGGGCCGARGIDAGCVDDNLVYRSVQPATLMEKRKTLREYPEMNVYWPSEPRGIGAAHLH